MKLIEAIQRIQYDDNWTIWAEVPFTPDSEARYGQRQFEQGGVIDDKEVFASGTRCRDFIAAWNASDEENEEEDVAYFEREAAERLIEEVEEERLYA